MKIRFLVVSIDTLGGTESAAVTQANRLRRHHDVEIVSVLRPPLPPRTDIADGVRVRYLTTGSPHVPDHAVDIPVPGAPELRQLPSTLVPRGWDPTLNALCDIALDSYLPRSDADVVVSMTPGLLTAAAQLLPRRVALVHQEHRSSMHRTAGAEALLAFAPRADAVVSLTEVNATWLREQLGDQAPPIHVVPNAAPGADYPQSFLDRPLIMAAGRLDGGKQYAQLVRAFGEIADNIPDWRLRIFGTGDQRRRLLQMARRYGLYDRVELPGTTEDLAVEWAKASVSALTSAREGLPLVVQESMAAGVPVVAYDCGTGPAELIDDGTSGFLVPQGDQEGLAARLLELATDIDLRRRMGKAAREAMRAYDLDTIIDRWETIYEECVAARRRGDSWLTRQQRVAQAGNSAVIGPPEPPRLTPGEVRSSLMSSLVDSFADLSTWFVLPSRGETPPTIVVDGAERRAAVSALGASRLPDYVSIAVTEEDHWLPGRGSVPDVVEQLASRLATGVAVGPWPECDGRATHLARGADVRLEFWSRNRRGELVAPRPNRFSQRVSDEDIIADQIVAGTRAPSLRGLLGPFVDEVRFPIDAVYTWVDDSDPEWQAGQARALAATDAQQGRREASGAARFRNRDELLYSLRSLHANIPWVRRVFIVTAGQRPSWLADHPDVVVVDHRDILPPEALPTFNSHAIETSLHRIPGLAEHFIYFNDDMMVTRPLTPEHFFAPSGEFAVFPSSAPIGPDGRDSLPFLMAAVNNRALLRDEFGVVITQTLSHAPYPLTRRVLEELSERLPEAMERTARSPFRAPTDVSTTSSLAQFYGMATGAAHERALDTVFIDTSKPGLHPYFRNLLTRRDMDTICIGDHHDYAMAEDQVAAELHSFLESFFPVPAPWEAR